MQIAIPLYDRFTALDAVGPYEVLSRIPGADLKFVATEAGPYKTTQWTTSVCTGSLLLGAAGILDGLEATSHWLELETLAGLGAQPTERRVVEQGKVVTSAGVSSGIDMALFLLGRISGEEFA